MINAPFLAYDRMPVSVRRIDNVGRLHVDRANISKANVCPYYGREIPLVGLEPDRIYYLLRHPDELAAGADTFNNLPILDLHIPHTAETPQKDLVCGSTGTDCRFGAPFLSNSLVIWAQDAIDRVMMADIDPMDPDGAKELSCGYSYTPDMTPGTFEGLRYDGIMRNIIGNHVALVREGRAGRDVIIGDGQLEMPKMIKSRRALMLNGALGALVRPLLAADAKLDLSPVLQDVTAANMAERKSVLASAIVGMAAPKLAQDKALTAADVTATIDTVLALDADTAEGDEIGAPAPAPAPAPTPSPAPAPAPTPTPAVDANVIRADVMNQMREVRDAERIVEPFIGALDSAPTDAAMVYRLALDSKQIDHAGIDDPKALKAMVQMLPKPDAPTAGPAPAMDAANIGSFDAAFELAPVRKV